jgi:hypothetical protein
MELFDVFLNNVVGNNPFNPTLTTAEKIYVASFQNDKKRMYSEFVRHVSQVVVDEDRKKFLRILDVLIATSPDFDPLLVDLLKPIFIVFEPRLTDILGQSHLFCCHAYNSGQVNEWIMQNPLIIETEFPLYIYIFNKFGKYIDVDIPTYSEKEVYSKKKCTKKIKKIHDRKEQYKQFYSCIIHWKPDLLQSN